MMQFMTIWTFRPEHSRAASDRFVETGGQPPDGVKMVARWHDVAGGRGFAIAEADDPAAISAWCRHWSDLLTFEIVPVINDEQLARVLAG
jgi:Domain of unknown function (DUF3303)